MALNPATAVGYTYKNITAAAPTTTTLATKGPGILHTLTINKPTSTGTITIYDGDATGTKIGTITVGVGDMPLSLRYDAAYTTGLTIVTATAACDLTVTYI